MESSHKKLELYIQKKYTYQESVSITASFRISHSRCFIIKGVLKNFEKFTRKHLCLSLYFNEIAGLKQKEQASRTTFLQNTSGQLLLSLFIFLFFFSLDLKFKFLKKWLILNFLTFEIPCVLEFPCESTCLSRYLIRFL